MSFDLGGSGGGQASPGSSVDAALLGQALDETVRVSVQQEIANQRRPGGLLHVPGAPTQGPH